MKTKYKLLNLMLEDMNKQENLYRPTRFWEHGSKLIIDELNMHNIEDFRNLKATRDFFVPGYTFFEYFNNPNPYNDIIKEFDKIVCDKRFVTRLNRLFTGYINAFNDFRVLQASNIGKKPYTDKISESNIGNPIEQIKIEERYFSKSLMNYLLGLNFLKQNVDTSKINITMEIGGGFGTLGEILLGDERNEAFYINADIPPISFISSYYLKELFGKNAIADYEDLSQLEVLDIEKLQQKYKAINICSWQVPLLKGKIDLFVNFISFQEMEPEIVQNYCNYIEGLKPRYILLRNMLEGKRKQNKDYLCGVNKPILGDDYSTFFPNYKLIASDSAIFGFITEDGFHSQLRIYERL